MELEVAVLSRTGGRRVNEDAAGMWSDAGACVCVLADGAGGHAGGDIASKLVVRHTLEWLRTSPDRGPLAVAAALDSANRAIVTEQQRDPRVKGMCATAVVLAIDTQRDVAVWGHVGDSRLYCFRHGCIVAQTRDHSVVQSMVDAGYLQPADLRRAPGRSRLLAALGDENRFDPYVERDGFSLLDCDKFLLCSDGLWEYVDERLMESMLAASGSAEQWLRAMESRVLACGRENQDNYSGIAVWCSDPGRTHEQTV